MKEDTEKIEKILSEFVNKYGINEITILIDDLWKHKTVKMIPKS